MFETFASAGLWFTLAALAALLASRIRFASALFELVIGIIAAAFATHLFGTPLDSNAPWLSFVASTGALAITFLAGSEVDGASFRSAWREITLLGVLSFAAPFAACWAAARFVLEWSPAASLLIGVVLGPTSLAITYMTTLDRGLNTTSFGKSLLGACFISNLASVSLLTILFGGPSPRTIVFLAATAAAVIVVRISSRAHTRLAHERAEIPTKLLFALLFGLGALAGWAGSEAVLPAYLLGVAAADTLRQHPELAQRLRSLTLGFLAPLYFLRAGAFVSVAEIRVAPFAIAVLLVAHLAAKSLVLYPVSGAYRRDPRERWTATFLLSTGLTFGIVGTVFGLSRGIIDTTTYSLLVTVVLLTAVIPGTLAQIVAPRTPK